MQKNALLALGAMLMVHALPASAQTNPGPACAGLGAAIAGAHKGVYYANDFSYLNGPCLAAGDPRDGFTKATDNLKRLELADGLKLDLGGEYRLRFHDENKMASTRLNGQNNAFTLSRLRVYANIEAGEHIRVYAEAIDARSFGENRPPRPIEANSADLLNGFVEFRGKVAGGKAFARAGRQELLFGAQRLISPLDWGNTRRSFDGFSSGYGKADWKVDAFVTWPTAVKPNKLDATDDSLRFSGVYASKGTPKTAVVDVYALNLREKQGAVFNFDIWTVGARAAGKKGPFGWEAEGGYQFGDHDQEGRQRAGFLALAGSYAMPQLPWQPSLHAGFDWAQGDKDGTDGKRQTFNQLFPLAHAYLGFMDLVARQNIQAVHVRAEAKPMPKLGLQVTGFNFRLDSRTDALYNAGGGGIRRDATGAAGSRVGNEVDVTASYAVTPRVHVLGGVSRFWGGRFTKATNPAGVGGNANFAYAQMSIKF